MLIVEIVGPTRTKVTMRGVPVTNREAEVERLTRLALQYSADAELERAALVARILKDLREMLG